MAHGLFVGRGRELALLRGLVAGVASGIGGAVLVEGEQGIGKTELLREGLAGASVAGCRVGWAAADELRKDLPLGLIMEGLRAGGWSVRWDDTPSGGSLIPAFDPVLAATERLLTFVDRICAAGPVVLVTEDLHLADEASVPVWRRLSKTAKQMPLLVVGSYRPSPSIQTITELRQDLLAASYDVIALGPLPKADVADLVGRTVGGTPGPALARLAARAGGNPFYVTELVDAVMREGHVRVTTGIADLTSDEPVRVPESLAEAIGDRLESLSDLALRVLRWAAVLGSDFSAADLETVSRLGLGELTQAITEAAQAGLVTEGGRALEFRHGLIRQVLYEGMPASVRSALHLRAARSMAEAGAAAEQVAAQLVAVSDITQRWIPGWIARAAPSLIYRAPELASDLLRRVLAELADNDPRRTGLEAELVTAAFNLGRYHEAERVGRGVLASAEDPDQAAEIARQLAYTLLRTGRAAEGAELTAEMLARPEPSEVSQARLEGMHALLLAALGRLDESAARGSAALARAERTGDPFGTAFALHTLASLCYLRGDHGDRTQYIERALTAIRDEPQAAGLRLILLSNLPAALAGVDRWSDALAAARQAVVTTERAGQSPRAVRTTLAILYFETGRWDDALAECELIVDLPGADHQQIAVHGIMARIGVHRDDVSATDRHLAAVDQIPLHDLVTRGNATALLPARALAAERAGQAGVAVATLAQVLDPDWEGVFGLMREAVPTLVRLALAVGDMATARAAVTALAAADRPELPWNAAIIDHCQGLVGGDPALALAAAAHFRSLGLPFRQAVTLEDAAALLALRGEIEAARSTLGEALSLYETFGATWDIRRASTRLRSLGVRRGHRPSPRSHPVSGWEALTPTELKVAYLVVDGLSNPDIAAELFLSRNTVQTHVSHILTKLAARSRAEIVSEALRHPAPQPAARPG